MDKIIAKAKSYKHHSLHYVEPDGSIYIVNEESHILIAEKHESNIQIHWACDSLDSLLKGLNTISEKLKGEEVSFEFVPPEFIKGLEKEGYHVKCEFTDFWIKALDKCEIDLPNTTEIRPLKKNETNMASLITKSCKNLSRGFDGENEEAIIDWLNGDDNEVFAAIEDDKIVGICMMATYENNDVTVAWLRELAVHPDHQRKGIGRNLAKFGLNWGKSKGASKSFLATDVENSPVIKLYNELGYKQVEGRGQINVIKQF